MAAAVLNARVILLVLCAGLAACGGEERRVDAAWTVSQAESIDSVRGLPIRRQACRGLARDRTAGRRYRRLRCMAGARLPGERFDTVAVLYEVRPTGRCCSDYALARVRFLGGPGIP